MALKGIDTASWQSGLDVGKVNADFVIIKATEGTTYVNPVCDTHYQQAKQGSRKRGVYHFASHTDAHKEAEYFVENTKGYHKDAILVLDWEGNFVGDVSWAKKWLDRVAELTGVKPLIYMSESVVNSHDWSSVCKDYGLWVAKYRDNVADFNYDMSQAGAAPSVKYWDFYIIWQWTSTGRLDGYDANLDLNEFYGDADVWDKYAGGSSAPAVTNPAPAPQAAQEETYTVKKGDILSVVFPNNWQAVAAHNGLPNASLIYPNQVLRIPNGSAPQAPAARTYTVERGDSLSAVFPGNWQEVARINNLANPSLIFPGQVLRIP